MKDLTVVAIATSLLLTSCTAAAPPRAESARDSSAAPNLPSPTAQAEITGARVTAVAVTGAPGAYQFSVTIESPDEGCDRYADWWEVLDTEGKLLYRRVLLHSHVNEQPFTRSGGPVPLTADAEAIVRAHFHPSGYTNQAQRGSVAMGFESVALPADFARAVAQQEPLPTNCAYSSRG